MQMSLSLIGTNADWTITIVRVTLGVIFFAHSAQKLLGWYGGAGYRKTMEAFTAPRTLLIHRGRNGEASYLEFFSTLGPQDCRIKFRIARLTDG
jgi:uncharacterized membrane protein YphA (DoxX/SURF4 family)